MTRFRSGWAAAMFVALWNACVGRESTLDGKGDDAPSPATGTDTAGPGEIEIARVRDGFIIRGRTTPPAVIPGQERSTFLAAAAKVLEVDSSRLDLFAPIMQRYGADELQLYECVLNAEDTWRVQLIPPRIPVRELAAKLEPFGTLGALIAAAEAAANARVPR